MDAPCQLRREQRKNRVFCSANIMPSRPIGVICLWKFFHLVPCTVRRYPGHCADPAAQGVPDLFLAGAFRFLRPRLFPGRNMRWLPWHGVQTDGTGGTRTEYEKSLSDRNLFSVCLIFSEASQIASASSPRSERRSASLLQQLPAALPAHH